MKCLLVGAAVPMSFIGAMIFTGCTGPRFAVGRYVLDLSRSKFYGPPPRDVKLAVDLRKDGSFVFEPFAVQGQWSHQGSTVTLSSTRWVAVLRALNGRAATSGAEMTIRFRIVSGDEMRWAPDAFNGKNAIELVFRRSTE